MEQFAAVKKQAAELQFSMDRAVELAAEQTAEQAGIADSNRDTPGQGTDGSGSRGSTYIAGGVTQTGTAATQGGATARTAAL